MTRSVSPHISVNFLLCGLSLRGALPLPFSVCVLLPIWNTLSLITFSLNIHYWPLMNTRCWAECDENSKSAFPVPRFKGNLPLFFNNPGYLHFPAGSLNTWDNEFYTVLNRMAEFTPYLKYISAWEACASASIGCRQRKKMPPSMHSNISDIYRKERILEKKESAAYAGRFWLLFFSLD